MTIVHRFPSVPGTYTPTPRAKKKPMRRGFQVRSATVPTLLTDHQVLEARWLSEFASCILFIMSSNSSTPSSI